jgi:hypothetical protein
MARREAAPESGGGEGVWQIPKRGSARGPEKTRISANCILCENVIMGRRRGRQRAIGRLLETVP